MKKMTMHEMYVAQSRTSRTLALLGGFPWFVLGFSGLSSHGNLWQPLASSIFIAVGFGYSALAIIISLAEVSDTRPGPFKD